MNCIHTIFSVFLWAHFKAKLEWRTVLYTTLFQRENVSLFWRGSWWCSQQVCVYAVTNCGRTHNSQAFPLHPRSSYCIDFSKSIHSSLLLAVQHINYKECAQLDKSWSRSGILFLLHTMKLRMSYQDSGVDWGKGGMRE